MATYPAAAPSADIDGAVRRAVLAALRVHRLRLQLALGDINMLEVSLERGCITPAQAVVSMDDMRIELPASSNRRAAA